MIGFRAGIVLAVACAAGLTAAAGQRADDGPLPFGSPASLRIDPAALRAEGAPEALLAELAASRVRYFRRLAEEYADRTCYAFRDLRWRLPAVAVHGDAHVEQFVVTDGTFGLEDFDHAGYGPAVVDLVRYAASLHLVCREVGWPCDAERAVTAYLDAYRDALDHPVERAMPPIVGRLRAARPPGAAGWLRWVESIVQPMPPEDEARLHRGWGRFVHLMREVRPDRPEAFYRIVRVGKVGLGVGSALEPKALIRVAGPSEAPDDDVVLEGRITTTPTGRECVTRPASGGSMHVMMFTVLLGSRLPDVFGFLPKDGDIGAPELWLQSWDRGYRELEAGDLRDQADLEALAVDAAHQLAGHFWARFPEPLRAHQRFAQQRAFEMTSARARVLARELATETLTEWERFRAVASGER